MILRLGEKGKDSRASVTCSRQPPRLRPPFFFPMPKNPQVLAQQAAEGLLEAPARPAVLAAALRSPSPLTFAPPPGRGKSWRTPHARCDMCVFEGSLLRLCKGKPKGTTNKFVPKLSVSLKNPKWRAHSSLLLKQPEESPQIRTVLMFACPLYIKVKTILSENT